MKESDLNSKLAYDITMGNFSLNLPTVKKKSSNCLVMVILLILGSSPPMAISMQSLISSEITLSIYYMLDC